MAIKPVASWLSLWLVLAAAVPATAGEPSQDTAPSPPRRAVTLHEFYREAQQRLARLRDQNDDALDRKLYRRWAWIMEDRLGPNDTFINVAAWKRRECEAYKKSKAYKKAHRQGRFMGVWASAGPVHYNLEPQTTSGGMGRLNVLAFHPKEPRIIFAGSASGALWRSSDAGLGWRPLTDAYGVSGIAFDPVDPQMIYYLTGDGNGFGGSAYHLSSIGVMKSKDNGATWKDTTPLMDPATPYYGYDLLSHPTVSGTLFATTNEGTFKTVDGGKTWQNILEKYSYDVEFKPGDPAVVYVSTQFQIFRSTNGGQNGSFRPVATFPYPAGSDRDFYNSSRIELAVTPADPTVVYAIFGGRYGLAGFYRSDNSGSSFTLRSTTPNIIGVDILGQSLSAASWFNLAVAAAPHDPDTVYAAGVNIWKSTDGGIFWSLDSTWDQTDPNLFNRYTHGDTHDLVFHHGSLYAATDGGIFMRTPGEGTWSDLSAGLAITQIYQVCGSRDADYFYFGCQDNGFNQLRNSVAIQIYLGDGTSCLIDPDDPTNFYAAFPPANFILRPGKNGMLTAIPPPGGQSAPWVLPIAAHPDDFQTLYGCYTDLWKSDDAGASWTAISRGHDLGPRDHCGDDCDCDDSDDVECDPNNACVTVAATPDIPARPAYIFVAREAAVYRSPQSEDHEWENITGNLCLDREECPHISDLAFNPTDHEEVWVTRSGFVAGKKVYRRIRQENGTHIWENVTGTLPNVPANTLLFDEEPPHGVFLGMECGVYYRDDNLEDWIPWNGPAGAALDPGVLPSVMVQDLLIQYDKARQQRILRAGTFNWGVWESPLYEALRPAAAQSSP